MNETYCKLDPDEFARRVATLREDVTKLPDVSNREIIDNLNTNNEIWEPYVDDRRKYLEIRSMLKSKFWRPLPVRSRISFVGNGEYTSQRSRSWLPPE